MDRPKETKEAKKSILQLLPLLLFLSAILTQTHRKNRVGSRRASASITA
jgi:hypothetical protein